MAITGSLFPAIVNAKKISEKLYYERLQKLYDLMTWLAIGIALPIMLLSNNIIKLLFGIQYQQAADVLRIYVWATVFVFLGVATGKYLVVENYTKISFLKSITGAIVNVILNIILIPKFKINGAAIATVISYFVSVFLIILIPKTYKNSVLMLKSFSPLGCIKRIQKRKRIR
jgi:O-antigen/teichoic acid export membrane protein